VFIKGRSTSSQHCFGVNRALLTSMWPMVYHGGGMGAFF
jgi:hypothetical protein